MTIPRIQPAAEADLEAVRRIYEHDVLNGTASFEIDPPDLESIRERWQRACRAGLPFLVAHGDNEVVAFAYALPYRPRPAYRYTVEHSIYVAPSWRRQGIGECLLDCLVDALELCGVREIVGIIGDSANRASLLAHQRAGFRQVGTLKNVGWKFDRWLDTVIVQRSLESDAHKLPKAGP